MKRTSVAASYDMRNDRRISQSVVQSHPSSTVNALVVENKKREITETEAKLIIKRLRRVKAKTMILTLISGVLSAYNWFGTYYWTTNTIQSYLDYILVTQIDQGAMELYQVPGCDDYVLNKEVANTTFAQIRSYSPDCPYNYCMIDLTDCSLVKQPFNYSFPIRFSANTQPSKCKVADISNLGTVICTFINLDAGDQASKSSSSNSRSACVFNDPSNSRNGNSTDKLVEYFTNYAKVKSTAGKMQVTCQYREAKSVDAQNPFETNQRSIDYLMLLILVCTISGVVVIKELFKSAILMLSLCYSKYRSPSWFILTLNSPLIIPFCFSDFHLALMMASKKKARSARLVFLDFVLENGLKLFITIFAIVMTTGRINTESLINLSSSILSAAYSVMEMFFGAASFAADQTQKLAAEKKELEERLQRELSQ